MTRKTLGLGTLLSLVCFALAGCDGCGSGPHQKFPPGSPVVIHGGSVYACTKNTWNDDGTHRRLNTDARQLPNRIELDNVYLSGSSQTIFKSTPIAGNWEIILTFTNDSHTQLQICPYKNGNACSPTGTLSSTTVNFITDSNGQLNIEAANPKRIDLSLGDCTVDPTKPDPACDHIASIELKGTSIDNTYQCPGKNCDIALFNK
jgi:hypothetical protein